MSQVPSKEKSVVLKAISRIREVATDAKGFDHCHQFFADNCPGGHKNTLKKTFNRALIWKVHINTGAGAMGAVGGKDIAYTAFGFSQGEEKLAAYLMHELMHNCGVGGIDHALADTAKLYCLGAGRNQLSILGGSGGKDSAFALIAYRRLVEEWASGRLQASLGADFNIGGIESGELASFMIGLTGRSNFLSGGERFGGLTLTPEVGIGVGRFRELTADESSRVSWEGGLVLQLRMGAEFAIPDLSFREGRRSTISLEAAFRIVQPLNSKAERVQVLLFGIGTHF